MHSLPTLVLAKSWVWQQTVSLQPRNYQSHSSGVENHWKPFCTFVTVTIPHGFRRAFAVLTRPHISLSRTLNSSCFRASFPAIISSFRGAFAVQAWNPPFTGAFAQLSRVRFLLLVNACLEVFDVAHFSKHLNDHVGAEKNYASLSWSVHVSPLQWKAQRAWEDAVAMLL